MKPHFEIYVYVSIFQTLRNSTNHTLPNSTAVYYGEDGDSGQSKEDVVRKTFS